MTLPPMFESLDETPLERSPIVTVIWQLRFEAHPTLSSPKSALLLRDLLGDESTLDLSPLPQLQVSVRAAGASPEEPPSSVIGGAAGGWRLSAKDGSSHVNIETSSVSIELTRYGSWETDFRPQLERVLKAVTEVGPPVLELRLGLRYVNVVVGNAAGRGPFMAAEELSGLIAPWLLGALTDERLRPHVDATQGKVELRLQDTNMIVNHAVVSAETGELGYLIDIDVFQQGARAFSADDALTRTTTLHSIALGMFQASLTDDLLATMRGTPATVAAQ